MGRVGNAQSTPLKKTGPVRLASLSGERVLANQGMPTRPSDKVAAVKGGPAGDWFELSSLLVLMVDSFGMVTRAGRVGTAPNASPGHPHTPHVRGCPAIPPFSSLEARIPVV